LNNLKDFLRIFSPQVLLFEYTLPLDRSLLASEGFAAVPEASGALVIYYRNEGGGLEAGKSA
jgi:hypothetical protein